MRALIYVRLSEWSGEDDPSMSPQGQEQACRDYAAAYGWDVVGVVHDLDVSGSSRGLRLDRPGIRELRSRMDECDVIVFKRLDRLARNVVDFRTFADECKERDVVLVSVVDRLDMTTTMGRFAATIVAAFAEMESDMIGDRVRDGRANQRSARRWGGGFVPWGYQSAPNAEGPGRVLVVNEHEAELATEIARRIVRGESLYSIGSDFRARGVEGRRSSRWDTTTINRLITSPSLVGVMMHNKQPLLDELGLPVRAWEPAIDPDLQAQAIETLAGRSAPKRERRVKAARLLSGLIVCPSCERPLALKSVRDVTQYACASRSRGVICSGGVSVKADLADSEAERQFLMKVGAWRRLVEVVHEREPDRDALRDVERALQDVGRAFQDPAADVDQLVGKRNALLKMRAELAAVKVERRTSEARKTLREEWNAGDLIDKQNLMREYVDCVKVRPSEGRRGFSPDRIIVEWNEGVVAQEGRRHSLVHAGGRVIVSADDPEVLAEYAGTSVESLFGAESK